LLYDLDHVFNRHCPSEAKNHEKQGEIPNFSLGDERFAQRKSMMRSTTHSRRLDELKSSKNQWRLNPATTG
jgi:hypothetical protein